MDALERVVSSELLLSLILDCGILVEAVLAVLVDDTSVLLHVLYPFCAVSDMFEVVTVKVGVVLDTSDGPLVNVGVTAVVFDGETMKLEFKGGLGLELYWMLFDDFMIEFCVDITCALNKDLFTMSVCVCLS